jgi:succinyl-CoA synthetase beta subunit
MRMFSRTNTPTIFCCRRRARCGIKTGPKMNIHEYQAAQLLAARGVNRPDGDPVSTPEEARVVAARLLAAGHPKVIVKAQIHAGGRGKGTFTSGYQGGVKLCASVGEVETAAAAMLGQVLVTRQTGPEGRRVKKLLVAAAAPVVKEFYLAVLLDRATSRPMVIASEAGGMDIEEVAERSPEKIIRESVDPALGYQAYQARRQAVALGLIGEQLAPAARLFQGAYRTWLECEASLVEINPLALLHPPDDRPTLSAIDAKISLDDNALFRHPDLVALRDLDEESPLEIEASEHGLNYIKLDGNIACLVNGAGLAMATMDIIDHYGGRPANFLDVGGGASPEQVAAAFGIILKDPHVQAILVNIFGGIMDCNVIATGIVTAARQTALNRPLVVRLEGNNVVAGRQTLSESGLEIVSGDSMADAARLAVQAARTLDAN